MFTMPLPQQSSESKDVTKFAFQMRLSNVYTAEMRLDCLSFFFELLSEWTDSRFTSSVRPNLEDDSVDSCTSIPSVCCFLARGLDGASFRRSLSLWDGRLPPLLDFRLVPVQEPVIDEVFFLLFSDSLGFKTQSNGVREKSVGLLACLLEGCPDFFTSDLEAVDDGVSNFWNETQTSSY